MNHRLRLTGHICNAGVPGSVCGPERTLRTRINCTANNRAAPTTRRRCVTLGALDRRERAIVAIVQLHGDTTGGESRRKVIIRSYETSEERRPVTGALLDLGTWMHCRVLAAL